MKNKKIKLGSVSMLFLSTLAITGCSDIKSYKNEVDSKQFLENLTKSCDDFAKDFSEMVKKYDKKSFEMTSESESESESTTKTNGFKNVKNSSADTTVKVLCDPENYACKIDRNSTNKSESNSEEYNTKSKSSKTTYADGTKVYSLNNMTNEYTEKDYNFNQIAQENALSTALDYLTNNINVVSSAFSQFEIPDEDLYKEDEEKCYVDGNVYTTVAKTNFEKDDTRTGSASGTAQIIFDKTTLKLYVEAEAKYTETKDKVTKKYDESLKMSISIEATETKFVVETKTSFKDNDSTEEEEKTTSIKSSGSQNTKITFNFKTVNISKSVEGYEKIASSYSY